MGVGRRFGAARTTVLRGASKTANEGYVIAQKTQTGGAWLPSGPRDRFVVSLPLCKE